MKLFLVLFAAFALAAAPAHADPFTGAVAAWVASTLAVSAATAAIIVNFAIGIGTSLISTALQAAGMKKSEVKVSLEKDIGDDTPLNLVPGRYVTPGKAKYIGSWGKNTRYITEVIEISCLPITGLEEAWANDEKAVIDWEDDGKTEGGFFVGNPVKNFSEGIGTSDERDRAWIKVYNGNQTTADGFLMHVFGDDEDYPWTADHIGRGKAYVILTYYYDPEIMTAVPSWLFQPEALPVYDIRKDSTAGGSGAHRWGTRSTYEASVNPAVIAYNIARGIYYGDEWLFGGKNLPAWRLPAAEWMAAANECDALVTLAAGGTQPAYRCGAEITVDMVPADVLEEIGRAANMRYAEVGGMLKPVVGLPGTSVLAITDENIVITEGQSFTPFNPISSTFNALTATYPEPAEKWASKDAKEYISTDATEADGGRYLPTSVSYGAVPYAKQVQRLMRSQMRDYRRFRRHQFHLSPEAYALEPMVDMITWTSARNGYDAKLFVVESVAKTPGMLVLVTLREVDPADYDWSSSFESDVTITTPVNYISFTQTISGFAVIPVAIKDNAGNDRRPGLRVSCDGDEVGVEDIQIQVRLATSTTALLDVKRPFGEPFAWTIRDLLPNTAYQVRARLLSKLTGRSAWNAWLTATTPNIKLGADDVEYADLVAEVVADLDELREWVETENGTLAADILANTIADAEQQVLINGVRATLSNTSAISGEFAAAALFGWGTLPAMWGVQARGSSGNSSVINSPTPWLLYMDQNAANQQAQMADGIPVKEGDVLEGSMMVAGSGTGFEAFVAILVYWHDAAGTQTGPTFMISSGTKTTIGWAEFTGQLTVPAGAARATFYLRRIGGGANTAYATQIRAGRVSGAVKDLATAQTSLAALVGVIDGEVTALAEAITEVTADVGDVSASGLFRINVESTPAGALSRIGLRAKASSGESNSLRSAALYLEAISGDQSQVLIEADRFAVVNGTARDKPFIIDGGDVYMANAHVRTLSIQGNAVSVLRKVNHGGSSDDTNAWTDCGSITFAPSISGDLVVWMSCQVELGWTSLVSSTAEARLRFRWRGSTVAEFIALSVRTDASGNAIGPKLIRVADISSFASGGTSSGTLTLQVIRVGGSSSTIAQTSDITFVIGEFKR